MQLTCACTGLNAPRFVTEAELEKIKELRGGSVEDGTVSVDKPLHEILRENKEKKARRARGLDAALSSAGS